MYIAVRKYKTTPGTRTGEIARRIHEGFLPIISQSAGFVAYYAVQAENDVIFSVSIFEDQAGAEESNRIGADWARHNLASLVQGGPEMTSGEVMAYAVR